MVWKPDPITAPEPITAAPDPITANEWLAFIRAAKAGAPLPAAYAALVPIRSAMLIAAAGRAKVANDTLLIVLFMTRLKVP
jgi:hypothetical protein